MPELQIEADLNLEGLTLHLEQDDPQDMEDSMARMNRILEKEIVECEDGEQTITYNNDMVREVFFYNP